MASSGKRDTPNISVVLQDMKFGTETDNFEYLFVNFENLDDDKQQNQKSRCIYKSKSDITTQQRPNEGGNKWKRNESNETKKMPRKCDRCGRKIRMAFVRLLQFDTH